MQKRKPQFCEHCGQEMRRTLEESLRDRRRQREARREEIQRRWRAGQTASHIAEEMGSTMLSVAQEMSRMRREGGYDLPYRYPPERVKKAARAALRTAQARERDAT